MEIVFSNDMTKLLFYRGIDIVLNFDLRRKCVKNIDDFPNILVGVK